MNMKTLIAGVLSCALVATAALADPPEGKGRGKHGRGGGDVSRDDDSGTNAAIEVGLGVAMAMFTDNDRATIGGYFDQHRYGAQRLPPGIAKNLARGKPLPPGIAKKMLPGDLVAGLPRRPGYDYIMAGSDVLLVEAATHVVSDILRNVVR
jgi:hypothetical protein